MSRKEILIEMLNGSLEGLERLPELIENETIFDETDHVDCNFLTSILCWMEKFSRISAGVGRSLERLIGIDDEKTEKKNKKDTGKIMSPENILKMCSLEDNVLKLPKMMINKKAYSEVKKRIENAGGKWSGGSVQGFTFPFDANRVFSVLQKEGRCDLAQDFQFFETPPEVADMLISIAGSISPEMKILEPSAGRGAIINAIHRACPDVVVDCFELMPENRQMLASMDNINLIGEDFYTAGISEQYDMILANPPFSRNQDIRHVLKMYDALAPGGRLVTVMGTHWEMGQESVCREFRDWITEIGASVEHLPAGTFKDSGTVTATTIIKIER